MVDLKTLNANRDAEDERLRAEAQAIVQKGQKSFDNALLKELLRVEEDRRQLERDVLDFTVHAVTEDGAVLSSKEQKELLARLLRAFGPAKLCLQPCQIPTPGHPGLCMVPKGGLGERVAVCAIPRGVPHLTCMCYPGDNNRYVTCPVTTCKQVVPVRAAKRHAEAHLGVNREDPKTLKERREALVTEALQAWMAERPGWAGLPTRVRNYAIRYSNQPGYFFTLGGLVQTWLGRGQPSGFWKKAIEAEATHLGVAVPPLGVKAVKAAQRPQAGEGAALDEAAVKARQAEEERLAALRAEQEAQERARAEAEAARQAAVEKARAEEQARREAKQWVGQEKERLDLVVTLKALKLVSETPIPRARWQSGPTQYERRYLLVFEDAAGNVMKWFTSACRFELTQAGRYEDPVVGATYSIRGTVKRLEVYQGQKETLLNRVVFQRPGAEDAPEPAEAEPQA